MPTLGGRHATHLTLDGHEPVPYCRHHPQITDHGAYRLHCGRRSRDLTYRWRYSTDATVTRLCDPMMTTTRSSQITDVVRLHVRPGTPPVSEPAYERPCQYPPDCSEPAEPCGHGGTSTRAPLTTWGKAQRLTGLDIEHDPVHDSTKTGRSHPMPGHVPDHEPCSDTEPRPPECRGDSATWILGDGEFATEVTGATSTAQH